MPARIKVTARVGDPVTEPDRTKQSFKDECDVNRIVARFAHNQVPAELMGGQASFGDFSSGESYQEMQNKVLAADDAFMRLPAAVRARFENEPRQLIEFFEDPKNLGEAVDLGLMPEEFRPANNVPTPPEPAPPEGGTPPE